MLKNLIVVLIMTHCSFLKAQCVLHDSIQYHSNKSIRSISAYCDSLRHGTYFGFYDNGNLKSYMSFEYGINVNFQLELFENGVVSFYCEFLNGKESYCLFFDERGDLAMEEFYEFGSKIKTVHYKQGEIIVGKITNAEEMKHFFERN
jgi:antitoxin component YwqK of YwqJK toxin-antitoxin module